MVIVCIFDVSKKEIMTNLTKTQAIKRAKDIVRESLGKKSLRHCFVTISNNSVNVGAASDGKWKEATVEFK